MTGVLLFCTADEAKPLVSKALKAQGKQAKGQRLAPNSSTRFFFLVETRTCPDTRQGFKQDLTDSLSFETDFIGATDQDCRLWARDAWSKNLNFIRSTIIVIVDTQSVRDETVAVQYYRSKRGYRAEEWTFGEYGVLPPQEDSWYIWRVHYQLAPMIETALDHGDIDAEYKRLFGLKEKFTDNRGIFQVEDQDVMRLTEFDSASVEKAVSLMKS